MQMYLSHCLLLQASQDHLEKHYADLKGRPFFPTLIDYMSSGPVVAMVRDHSQQIPILFLLLGKRVSWGSANGAAGFIGHFSCSRCGKARVWWRRAGWCWARPTPQTLSPEPSEETSASMSASEFYWITTFTKNCHAYSVFFLGGRNLLKIGNWKTPGEKDSRKWQIICLSD